MNVGGWVGGWLEEFMYCSPRVTASGKDPTRTLTGHSRGPDKILLRFTGPEQITARMRSTPQRPFPFSHRLVQFPTFSHYSPLLGPANITHTFQVCLAALHRLYASRSASLVLFSPTAVAVPPLGTSAPQPSDAPAPPPRETIRRPSAAQRGATR